MTKNRLRIFHLYTHDPVVAGFITRLVASIDRIPATQAFIFLGFVGALEGFVLFKLDSQPRSVSAFWFLCLLVPTLSFIRFSHPVVTQRESGSLTLRFLDCLKNLGRLAALHTIVIGPLVIGCLAYPFASSFFNKTSASSAQQGASASSSAAIATNSSTIAPSAFASATPFPSLSAAATTSAPSTRATPSAPSSSSGPPAIATTSSKAAARAPTAIISDKPEQPRPRTLGDSADP